MNMGTGATTLAVVVIAVVVAMLVAVVIQVLVATLGRLEDRAIVKREAARPAPKPLPDVATAAIDDGKPPPAHVAAIVAAVNEVLGGGRVVHIEPSAGRNAAWSARGRQAHHSSHNLGRRSAGRPVNRG